MKELKHLNKYFIKYKWHLFLGFIFIILSNYFFVYAPTLFNEGTDFMEGSLKSLSGSTEFPQKPKSIIWLEENQLISPINSPGNDIDRKKVTSEVLIKLAVLFGFLYVIRGIFLFFTRVTIIIMSRRIEYDLKNEIFNHYQKLSLAFYKRNNTGDLMNRISEDVSKVRMYLGPAVMYTLNLLCLISFVLYEMINISPKLTFYTLLPLPILSISIYFVSSVINKKSEEVQKKQSALSSFVQESTSGIRVLKAYNKERSFTNTFSEESGKYKSLILDLVKVEALFMPLIILLVGLSTLLAIYLGGIESIERSGFDKGDIIQFVIYVSMLTWPFASVGWVTSLINKAEASQGRINEFLLEKSDIECNQSMHTPIDGKIEFKEVSFTYPDTGIQALKDVNFTLEKGKTLGITGRTGSGKSSLVSLISRQFDPTNGEILIDGKNSKLLNLESLRSSIGAVPQDVFLFSDTVRNNIAFSDEKADFEDIINASKEADIYDNIMNFPEGFKTMLGEFGINLSGGQKQRISIARAILKNPRILIFDDCLSAVDTETEEKILNSLKKLMNGKSSIITSHRISSIMNADLILVLENGEITQKGTHLQLIQGEGYYKELYEKQQIESI